MNQRPKLRMYCITLRHLSSIQKGIQSAHAVVEYSKDSTGSAKYERWMRLDKTLIILECNSSNELSEIRQKIEKHIFVEDFKEPDLDNITTSIAFLLDETIWNLEKYPSISNKRVNTLRESILSLRLAI